MCVLPEAAAPSNAAVQAQMKSDQGDAWNADAGGMIKKFDTARSWAHTGLEAASGMSKEQSKAFGKVNAPLGHGMNFASHLLGDEQIADTKAGHVANATAKTAADGVLGHAADKAGAGGPLWAKALSALDGFLDVDNPLKMATHLANELSPTSAASKGLEGGVDAATVFGQYATGDEAAAHRGADAMQEKSMNGGYGAPTQAGTWWSAYAMGDHETTEKATDQKAKTGERGMTMAWGNAIADGWMGDDNSSDHEVVIEPWDAHKDMAWYKPWSW